MDRQLIPIAFLVVVIHEVIEKFTIFIRASRDN